jgi:hypothetical protein
MNVIEKLLACGLLNQTQVDRFNAWCDARPQEDDGDAVDCIGAWFSIRFIPTGIGPTITVEDLWFDRSLDLSEDD